MVTSDFLHWLSFESSEYSVLILYSIQKPQTLENTDF